MDYFFHRNCLFFYVATDLNEPSFILGKLFKIQGEFKWNSGSCWNLLGFVKANTIIKNHRHRAYEKRPNFLGFWFFAMQKKSHEILGQLVIYQFYLSHASPGSEHHRVEPFRGTEVHDEGLGFVTRNLLHFKLC